jgi:hypothetical protein
MAHWRAALPVPMFELQYERLVSHTRETIGELLEFCGVPWEQGCIEFYRTERGVRTPSRWQVRQPVYSQSVGRSRHYARYLHPLTELLAGASAIRPAAAHQASQ